MLHFCADLLTSEQNVVIAAVGDDVTLNFNRRKTHINDYLHDPTWTFNGEAIETNQSRYIVSDDGLSLGISGVVADDYGIYSLQYNGLNLHAHNEFCEQTTLSFLRDYPILSPGYIIVSFSEGLSSKLD